MPHPPPPFPPSFRVLPVCRDPFVYLEYTVIIIAAIKFVEAFLGVGNIYHSGRKYKDLFVFILMYNRFLYFRPERYAITAFRPWYYMVIRTQDGTKGTCIPTMLTLLEPQSRFGWKLLEI